MSVASYPPPDDLPVAPPPTPEVPDAVAPTPPALEAAKAPQGDAGDPTPAGQPSFYAGSVPVYVGGVTAPEPLKFIGPAAPAPTVAELQEQIRTLQAQLAENVSNAKYVCDAALSGLRIVAESGPLARVAELEAERDYERKRANEALSQLHDVKEAMKAGDEGYRMVERENREACHLLMLLGIKVGTLPDMIAALLPRSRLLKLRIRNETAAALAIDNLSLQEVAEDDPRMAAAIARHREATALRRAAEPDHSPDAGNMVQG